MESNQAQKQGFDLIPPKRRLKAALRKSAERARRLAQAFGKTIPVAKPAAPKPDAKKARAPKQA